MSLSRNPIRVDPNLFLLFIPSGLVFELLITAYQIIHLRQCRPMKFLATVQGFGLHPGELPRINPPT
jgi:hypothetical protein